MADIRDEPIIIKKYPKKGGEGHGGSWKVAYADFVTAMMAFFLLLWLLTMTSQQKRIQLSEYFQNYSMFEKGGGSAIGQQQDIPGSGLLDAGKAKKKTSSVNQILASQLAEEVKKQVRDKLREYKDRVIVYDDNGNLRIEIIDTGGESFFTVGGTELNESGKTIIRGITPTLKDLDKKLIIEGHTDSLGYKAKSFTNWELSTQRASAARVELEKNGVTPDKIAMVVGYADTRPLIKDRPSDPMNRRISIMVDYKGQSSYSPPTQIPPFKPAPQKIPDQ
jgi:chemotaxis protein MotB